MQIATLLPFLALSTGCYETPQPPCAFSCGPGDDCPPGYTCRADTWCKRNDVGDDFACAPPGPDAGPAPADGASGEAPADLEAAPADAPLAGAVSFSPPLAFSPSMSGS